MIYKNNKEFIDYLYTYQDIKYRDFHKSLLGNNNKELIGIRTPELKKIAKELSTEDYNKYLKINKHKYYEEDTINGLLLGYLKLPFNDILNYLDDFTNYIDNWATCDLMCSNLKIFKKNLEEGFTFINKLIDTNNPWKIRVGVVLLLNYYMNDNYLNKIYSIIDNILNDEYYVKMGISWLISYMYIFNPKSTVNYLKHAKIDKFTYNKSIQKIIESYRVDIKDKEYLKTLKK